MNVKRRRRDSWSIRNKNNTIVVLRYRGVNKDRCSEFHCISSTKLIHKHAPRLSGYLKPRTWTLLIATLSDCADYPPSQQQTRHFTDPTIDLAAPHRWKIADFDHSDGLTTCWCRVFTIHPRLAIVSFVRWELCIPGHTYLVHECMLVCVSRVHLGSLGWIHLCWLWC